MECSPNSKVSVADEVMVKVIRGEAVLLNLKSEQYLGLNPVGTRMWIVLQESPSIQAAYETLLAEYDVEPETLQTDLAELLDQLTEQGLIKVSPVDPVA